MLIFSWRLKRQGSRCFAEPLRGTLIVVTLIASLHLWTVGQYIVTIWVSELVALSYSGHRRELPWLGCAPLGKLESLTLQQYSHPAPVLPGPSQTLLRAPGALGICSSNVDLWGRCEPTQAISEASNSRCYILMFEKCVCICTFWLAASEDFLAGLKPNKISWERPTMWDCPANGIWISSG